MLKRTVVQAMRYDFFERYEKLWQQDKEIKESFDEFLTLVKENGLPDDNMLLIEDGIYSLLAPAEALAYYMGIQDGIELMNALTDKHLAVNMLKAMGDWEGGQEDAK